MAIPNPNPNIADGIKSDNKTYSSNKIESLIKTATELPIPEAGDAGKVLTVNSDSDGYELDYAGHDLIDDNTASSDTVYSSSKVDTLLSGKADTSSIPVNVAHRVSVNSNTISALISFHSFIMLAGYVYLFVRTSPTEGTLYNVTDGTSLATVNGTGSFGILNFALANGILTITTNDSSNKIMSIYS